MSTSNDTMHSMAVRTTCAARWLEHSNRWMVGAIGGAQLTNDEARLTLADAVIDCLELVDTAELPYSSCTDGRRRNDLFDGGQVPTRQQLVGTDTVAAFVAAEALGERFYGTSLYSPVHERLQKVMTHMHDNGLVPTAHVSCGAAGGFTTVLNRSTQFIDDQAYIDRLIELLPAGMYDTTIHKLIVGGYQSRLDSGVYNDYKDGMICDVVQQQFGEHAIERYVDDGKGVHGHTEQAIVYIDSSLPGLALNPNKLADKYGLQVFVVNKERAHKIALIFAGNDETSLDYVTARIAIEDFAAAGHGTLAYGMETLLLSRQN